MIIYVLKNGVIKPQKELELFDGVNVYINPNLPYFALKTSLPHTFDESQDTKLFLHYLNDKPVDLFMLRQGRLNLYSVENSSGFDVTNPAGDSGFFGCFITNVSNIGGLTFDLNFESAKSLGVALTTEQIVNICEFYSMVLLLNDNLSNGGHYAQIYVISSKIIRYSIDYVCDVYIGSVQSVDATIFQFQIAPSDYGIGTPSIPYTKLNDKF